MTSSLEYDPSRRSTLSRAESRWMMGLSRTVRRPLALAVAAPLVAGILLAAQAWTLAHLLHRAIVGHEAMATLVPGLALIAAFILVRAGLGFFGERAAAGAAEAIKASVRRALFGHLLAARPDWSRERASGLLAGAIVDQTEALDGFFARYLPAMVAATVLPIAFALGVALVEPFVGILFLITAPLIPVFMALVGWSAEAVSRRHIQAFARLSGLFADRLRGLGTLKLFGRAEAEVATVAAASEDLRHRTLAVLRIAFLSSAVLEFFAALGVAGVALYIGFSYLGYLDFMTARPTLATGLFCLFMAPEVYFPLRQFAAHYHDRAAARAAVAEIASLFETLPAVEAPPAAALRAAPTAHAALAVAVRDLRVTPTGARAPVLDGLALDVAAGEHIAILGPSGSGKTTLIETLAGLRQADGAGAILIGGRPLEGWREDAAELRARLTLIGQRPHIVSGTLADNIRFARPEADAAAIRAAAEAAEVAAFADRLPDGLSTEIGPRGYGLSGGEAQRVALARLFLRGGDLVLLDEPTAHLDAATELRLAAAIRAFARGRTLIVATHARPVARLMDRIVEIEDGRLVPVAAAHVEAAR
ncbi:thiol reductant ABC exporter subunit CydD [Segnochrobactrum spirostomi]|uniref:Thiol reductant ABC exporter subunit CydD n=1 Tax=Segnochrobactrum spirostomi TaxID=2608987 RepID=A0A6A7Y1F1_9HYPH|nr:thiol reductant ABC exporter subunit CydD [Segnochrobactrum spirostomi]MQT12585.1 thiol reductant ABC exporter subunit CydD [Segnochrobactrum spirostomi]